MGLMNCRSLVLFLFVAFTSLCITANPLSQVDIPQDLSLPSPPLDNDTLRTSIRNHTVPISKRQEEDIHPPPDDETVPISKRQEEDIHSPPDDDTVPLSERDEDEEEVEDLRFHYDTVTTFIDEHTEQFAKRQDVEPPHRPPFLDKPGLLQCEPSPTRFYQNSHKKRVGDASEHFCDHFETEEIGLDHPPIMMSVNVTGWHVPHPFAFPIAPGPRYDWTYEWHGALPEDLHEVTGQTSEVYDCKIEVIKGCLSDDGSLPNLHKPVKHWNCKKILWTAWKKCNNLGRGGSYQAGCLRYSIRTRF